jgi:hypothetical protein
VLAELERCAARARGSWRRGADLDRIAAALMPAAS